MKFLCPNCKAKYQISDEKIAGRTLKMDCRRCNHPIVIRGDRPADASESRGGAPREAARPRSASSSASWPAQQAAQPRRRGGSHVGPAPTARSSSRTALGADFRKNAGAPAAAAKPTALDQWHVAINDVPVGPMKRDEVGQKITAGAVKPDSLVWREGFDDWRPLKDVPELAALLRRHAPAPPPPAPARALGRSGPPAAARPARPPAAARAPAPAATRPAATPAAAPAAARGNVVPIGGRLGAAAAPAIDDFSDEMLNDDEPTRVGSSLEIIQAEEERRRVEEEQRAAEQREEEEARAERERADAEEAARLASERARQEEEARERPVGYAAPDEDAFDPFASQRASAPAPAVFPAPPTAAAPAAFVSPAMEAPTPLTAVPEPRRRGLPVGAWIAIAGAMAFGVTLAVMVGIKLFQQPQAPLALNGTGANGTREPAATPDPPEPAEAVPDPNVPDPSAAEAPDPVAEGSTEQAQPPGNERPSGGGGSRPPRGAQSTTEQATQPAREGGSRPAIDPEAEARLAQFADDGAEAAPIAVRPNTPLSDDERPASAELSADQIRAVVSRERSGVQRCYETAARMSGQAPRLRIDVDVTVGGSGTVTSATARGPSFGNLSDCIEGSVRRWRFPRTGGTTRTSIPFVFQGRDE